MIRLRTKTSPAQAQVAANAHREVQEKLNRESRARAVDSLRALSEQFEARSAAKLLAVARRHHVPASPQDIKDALAGDVGKQLFAPKPRAEGKSATEGPGQRIQADLIDLSNNASAKPGEHKYGLVVTDVFSRKTWTQPLKYKDAATVDPAMRALVKKIPGVGASTVVSTDQGNEWKGLESHGVLPKGAVHREKEVEDRNAIAVVDRTIQSLKKDLASNVARTGQNWSTQLHGVTDAYNARPHSGVHGAPDGAYEDGPQKFFIEQDNAAKFLHNRNLTLRRQEALKATGAFRSPVHNETRSFRPAYEDTPQRLGRITPGAGFVENTNGRQTLFKHALPVPRGSGKPLAHLTAPRGKSGAREAEPQRVFEGGSSGSGGANPASPRVDESSPGVVIPQITTQFTEAQRRRQDSVSKHIMTYEVKKTPEQKAEEVRRKAQQEAEKDQKRQERVNKSAAAEIARQQKQLERFTKKLK